MYLLFINRANFNANDVTKYILIYSEMQIMITRTIKTETESLGSICTSSSVNVFNQRFVSLPTFSRCCFLFLPCQFMFESILSWILGFFLLKSKNVIPDGISEQGSRIFLFLELQCCVEFHFLNVKGYLYQKAASS